MPSMIDENNIAAMVEKQEKLDHERSEKPRPDVLDAATIWNTAHGRKIIIDEIKKMLEYAVRDSKEWSVRKTGERLYLNKKTPYKISNGKGHDLIKSFRIVPCNRNGDALTKLVSPPGYDSKCKEAAKFLMPRIREYTNIDVFASWTMGDHSRISINGVALNQKPDDKHPIVANLDITEIVTRSK